MIFPNKKTALIIMVAFSIIGIYIFSVTGILNPAIEKIINETPEAKISAYLQAVSMGDKEAALKIWEYPTWNLESGDYVLLKDRREKVMDELTKGKVASNFTILDIEWWNTCCIPSITDNHSTAGGARIKVKLTDENNIAKIYIFDILTREPYSGGVIDEPKLRHWVIRDIYLLGEEPLFWKVGK